MACFKSFKTFDSFFDAKIKLCSVTGNNNFENPMSNHQQGGAGVLATNEVLSYYQNEGINPHKLSKWTSIILEGSATHWTRVVTAYCMRKAKPEEHRQV